MGPNRKSRLMRALGIGLVLSALFLVFGGNGQAADDPYALMDGVIARMHAAMHVAPSGDPDRDFARMMISAGGQRIASRTESSAIGEVNQPTQYPQPPNVVGPCHSDRVQ